IAHVGIGERKVFETTRFRDGANPVIRDGRSRGIKERELESAEARTLRKSVAEDQTVQRGQGGKLGETGIGNGRVAQIQGREAVDMRDGDQALVARVGRLKIESFKRSKARERGKLGIADVRF